MSLPRPIHRARAPFVAALCLSALAASPAAAQTPVRLASHALHLDDAAEPAGRASGGGHASDEDVVRAPGALFAIPVDGVAPGRLRDTYEEARSGGRTHDAIDIPAACGTPVRAAADGRVLRLRTGGLGGITLYQVMGDGRARLYYAHLSGYAEGISRGDRVRAGDVIAYVGDTGNARPGDCHLHFSVALLDDPDRWWEGDNVNPYPLLAGGASVEPAPVDGPVVSIEGEMEMPALAAAGSS